jgi:hypothetical protein
MPLEFSNFSTTTEYIAVSHYIFIIILAIAYMFSLDLGYRESESLQNSEVAPVGTGNAG